MIKCSMINNLVNNFKNNKLAHAFLIETDNYDLAMADLIEFLKVINCSTNYKEECNDCNLCHLISMKSFPNLHIVEPDGQAIKKEQILDLKRNMETVPYISEYNSYIINKAEKLNSSSANAMLKFIEEPEDNIIGFFITNNKENVIDTVKSRCEIIKAIYNDEEYNTLNFYKQNYGNIYEEAVNYIKYIKNSKSISILYNKKILEKNYDRDELIIMFKIILEIYNNVLNSNVVLDELQFLKMVDKKKIFKETKIIIDIIEKLNYNTNLNLMLDYFIIELGV